MEADGVAQAVYEHGGAEMVIVRGISDFADERKSELDTTPAAGAGHGAWRRYAALNAADLLATMLRGPGFPWPSLGTGGGIPVSASHGSSLSKGGFKALASLAALMSL
jgi:hypothetical protein